MNKINVESVEYAVRHVTRPSSFAAPMALCLHIYGTCRGKRYCASVEVGVDDSVLSRTRVYATDADGGHNGERGGALRERFHVLGRTLAEAWRTTDAYEAAYLACVRKDLVRIETRWESETAQLTTQLRMAKKYRAKARRTLAAFDKKHPPDPVIPFG